MTQLARQLRWFIGIRLVAITSVVLPYLLLQIRSEALFPQHGFLYLLAAGTYFANLVYIGFLRLLRHRETLQVYIQFAGDLVLISCLIYFFGGIASPFSVLYLIIIIVASTILRRQVGVIVGLVAWSLYAALALALQYELIPPSSIAPSQSVSFWSLTYNLVTHLFAFYAVSILSSHLAQNVAVAERRLAAKREDLARLQVIYRDVVASIPSGLITTDLEGLSSSANPAAEEILAIRAPELIGHPVFELGLFSVEEWNQSRLLADGGGQWRDEVEREFEGRNQYIGFAVTAIPGQDGNPSGYSVIFQDLTESRQLRQELQLKDRMAAVGELGAGIAHELGNPLAAITGSVQMLSQSLSADSPQHKLLDIILKEGERLDRTIKSFLRFARPKERSSVPFDVAELLSENVELLRNSAEVSELHRIELRLHPPSATLIADLDQVSQIFWNLTRNGLRAMPDGGVLSVRGELVGDIYRLQVGDTGRGMSEAERANLFHPFQSFFDGGMGIGMAIVYRIVEEHHGRVLVESVPKRGTTITVELPVAPSTRFAPMVEAEV